MSDRHYCTLTLSGILPIEKFHELKHILNDAGCDDDDLDDFTPDKCTSEILERNNARLSFPEVKNGTLDTDLEDLIRNLQLSYIWETELADSAFASIAFYDALTKETVYYDAYDGALIIKASDFSDPEITDPILRWNKVLHGDHFLYAYASAHQLIALDQTHPNLAVFKNAIGLDQ